MQSPTWVVTVLLSLAVAGGCTTSSAEPEDACALALGFRGKVYLGHADAAPSTLSLGTGEYLVCDDGFGPSEGGTDTVFAIPGVDPGEAVAVGEARGVFIAEGDRPTSPELQAVLDADPSSLRE